MKVRITLVAVAILATVSIAFGGSPAAPKSGGDSAAVPGKNAGGSSIDVSTADNMLLNNPSLLKEIDDTLIKTNGCRTMGSLGYANGYQCGAGAPYDACMKMLKDGKVDACAKTTGRNYGVDCNESKEKTSPEERAQSKCMDLSPNLWDSLATRMPLNSAKKRLEAFGCKMESETTVFCKGHVRDWLCKPLERGGVVTCRPPKKVKQCGSGDIGSKQCYEVEG